jgi:general L-amino acid transport system permease protein
MSRNEDQEPPLAGAAAFEEEPVGVAMAPPRRPALGPFGWTRVNLFNTPLNAILTLVSGALLVWAAVRLGQWALWDATWTGTAAECRARAGACWAVVANKHRLILFGVYPYDQQWRPFLASMLFVALVAASGWRRCWRPWLGLVWLAGLILMAVLMWGGVLGLPYVEDDRWGGVPVTLLLAIFGILLSFPLAVALALGRRSDLPAIRAVATGVIEIMRGVPLISVLFMASVMFPLFLPEGVSVDKLLRVVVGIALFGGAYLAEAIRGGLQAIPRGQYEAADALGLGYWRKMGLIILPQALRLVIPAMVNQFISCFKDTSLVTIVGLFDLLTAARTAVTEPEWQPFFVESYIFAALLYWVACYAMSKYSQGLERALDTARRE